MVIITLFHIHSIQEIAFKMVAQKRALAVSHLCYIIICIITSTDLLDGLVSLELPPVSAVLSFFPGQKEMRDYSLLDLNSVRLHFKFQAGLVCFDLTLLWMLMLK